MGQPYSCYADYRDDPEEALRAVQQRYFEQGHYHPAMFMADAPAHESIADARRAAGSEGTRSILDAHGIGQGPGYAEALDDWVLERYCGTTQPTRDDVRELIPQLSQTLERGEIRFTVIYDETGEPDEYLFIGCSLT